MSQQSFNWTDFLRRWRDEWVPREEQDEDEQPRSVTLGRPGAPEAVIVAAEERLGRRLPPSYREFLAVSDGWYVDQMAGIYRLGGAADIDWFQDPYGMTEQYGQGLGDDPRGEDLLLAGMWQRALRLEADSDMTNALLDPGDRDQDGEWALYIYHGWSGKPPDRYPSFRAYVEAMYRGFHADRAARSDFVNATTRAQDTQVDQARLLALRGRYEQALPLLEEAMSFGRPRSAVLLNQLQQLQAPRGAQGYDGLVGDPRYLSEVLPLEAMTPAHHESWRNDDDHWLMTMSARGVARETAESTLGALRDGTHRYTPPGPWGQAVADARECARWGANDAAWRVLRDALPRWEAPGPELIAPIGLLADPILGPLITPERGREILATPRAGQRGPAPEPAPDLDPPGLLWLTEPMADGQPLDGYRCLWIEGVDPTRLPALIGVEGTGLGAPMDPRMAFWWAPKPDGRGGVEPWEDRAVVVVGRTTEAWTFAFDGRLHHRLNQLFRSPAVAASTSGRAVVVWRDPSHPSPADHPAAFHLSVAEAGAELYAFTMRGTEIHCSGAIPDALDPLRLFRPQDTELEREEAVLRALHTELNLSLPRFALTQGRLHTLTTRSWARAPHPGEGFASVRLVRHRP